MPNNQGKGFVDYVLWGDDGRPIGLVEAKRTRRDSRVGQQQAKLYADCLERQFEQRPERMLAESGIGAAEDIERAAAESHGLGLFVRSLVGLDREAAKGRNGFRIADRGGRARLDERFAHRA